MHLFAYGTLMCEDIMAEVSGLAVSAEPAVLAGYRRHCVRHECYPAIVANENSRVDGVLYRDLTTAAWQRLDAFEGRMYVRQPVQLALEKGIVVEAQTYVLSEEFRHSLVNVEWDFQSFLRTAKTRFEREYRGYEAL